MDSDDIKQLIATMLRHMRVGVDSIETVTTDGRKCFSIKTPDSHLLIGAKGANLSALNHLVKRMVSAKSFNKDIPSDEGGKEQAFFIDVNGYHEAAKENIKNMAKIMGERARSFKASVELEPMSSYERMVIHSYFQEAPDLTTQSVGDGEKRRVVIKYVEDKLSS